jgi:hypothetical protein
MKRQLKNCHMLEPSLFPGPVWQDILPLSRGTGLLTHTCAPAIPATGRKFAALGNRICTFHRRHYYAEHSQFVARKQEIPPC